LISLIKRTRTNNDNTTTKAIDALMNFLFVKSVSMQ
jgi:hypothetical protein